MVKLDRTLFGPAGFPSKGPRGVKAFGYLAKRRLYTMEYQAVRSVRIGKETAQALGSAATEAGVVLTLHAPYALNLCSQEKSLRIASIKRLYRATWASNLMGAVHTTFHAGYYGKLTKGDAMAAQIGSLKSVRELMRSGNCDVELGPETSGKMSQFGDLEEVLTLSETIPNTRPTIDFGHLNVRGDLPRFHARDDYARIFDVIETRLGTEAINGLVIHFSEVEPTKGGIGERRHHPLGRGFGPPFKPLAETIIENGYRVIFISETPLLEGDAVKMRRQYEGLMKSAERTDAN